jgi:IclR helix-turn-helix domain
MMATHKFPMTSVSLDLTTSGAPASAMPQGCGGAEFGVSMTRLRDVEKCFAKSYQLTDFEPLHVVLAVVAANQLEGDPVWLLLVAPPSSLKSEIIRALIKLPAVYPLSSLTAQTLASGYEGQNGREPSLLLKLREQRKRVLTLKDFTTVLTMHRDKRAEILSQLREVYDGQYRKEFGTGKVVDWNGKLGLIAGVTPVIDTQYTVTQLLGERFLLYRLVPDDPVSVAQRAIQQQGTESAFRNEIPEVVARFFQGLTFVQVDIPEPIESRLAALAAFTARARSGVMWSPQGEIEYIPAPEGPGRIAKQLATLAKGLAIVRETTIVTAADYLTLFRVAEDTAPAQRRTFIDCLVKLDADGPQETKVIADATGYPSSTTRRYLRDLAAMGLVDRSSVEKNRDQWALSDLAVNFLRDASPVGLLEDELLSSDVLVERK